MEEIRKNHNEAKRDLIQSVTNEGAHILDVGCGFGGDLQKWHKCGANINMCDPEPTALESLMWCVSTFHFIIYFRRGTFFSVRCVKSKTG